MVTEPAAAPIKEVSPPIIETPAVSPPVESTAATGQATEGLIDQDTEAAAQSTEGDAGEFSLDDIDEWKAVLEPEASTEPAPVPKLGGQALADIERNLQAQRARNYRTFMESGNAAVVADLVKVGFNEAEASQIWGIVQPRFNAQYANHEDYSNALDNASVRLALTEDEQKLYFGEQYTDRVQAKKALVTLGRALERQLMVKEGYVSKEQLAKIKTATQTAVRAELEKAGVIKGASSGEHVEGAAPRGTNVPYAQVPLEIKQKWTPAQRDAHFARYG